MSTEISYIIEKLMESPLFKQRWIENRIKTMWIEWVGEKLAQHIVPDKIEDDQLTLIIDDERWEMALVGLQDKVLEKLNKGLGGKVIKDFVLVLDKKGLCETRKKQKKGPLSPLSNKINNINHTEQELDDLTQKNLEMIKDSKIRYSLRRILIKSKTFNQKQSPPF